MERISGAAWLEAIPDAVVIVIIYRDEAGLGSGKISASTRSPLVLNPGTRIGMQKFLSEVHPGIILQAR